MKEVKRKERGITLIALIITVLVMLILAGVAISALTTDGNLFSKTQSAVEKYNNAVKLQDEKIAILTNEMNNYFNIYSDVENVDTSDVIKSLNAEVDVKSSNEISISSVIDIKDGYEGDLVYTYYLNNESLGETTETIKVISNLTPNTSYKIYISVKDANGGIKYSNKVTVKTKERIYLYKEGDECIELTGGWQRGSYNSGSLTKEATYMNLYGVVGTTRYNSVETVNEIDFSGYDNICFEVEYENQKIINGKYYTYYTFAISSPRYVGYYDWSEVLIIRDPNPLDSINVNERVVHLKEIPSGLKGYPTVSWNNSNTGFPSSNLKIYNVWLEK